MIASFSETFKNDQAERQSKQFMQDFTANAIKEKRCWICANTYKEYWNNHGHEDTVTMCKFSKKCVEFDQGERCSNWEPKDTELT